MKYNVGDRVRIKSLDWYNENKDEYGYIDCGSRSFFTKMSDWCGKIATIKEICKTNCYHLEEYDFDWTDEMIECKVEEEIKPKFKVGDKITNGEITFTILTLSSDRYGAEDTFGECGSVCFKSQDEWKIVKEETKFGTASNPIEPKSDANCITQSEVDVIKKAKTFWDGIKDAWICPEGYIFKDENGNIINATKIVLEKKKKEYPNTYEECYKIMGVKLSDCYIQGYKSPLLEDLQELLICRDAYWKIAGKEMGLEKPWKPDLKDYTTHKFIVHTIQDKIHCGVSLIKNHIFSFPTEEMRDTFYENFKEEIEICKELL